MNKEQKEVYKRVTIKSVKTMQGLDGLIIKCNIFLDNKKVAMYRNDGNGGMGLVNVYPIKDDFKINNEKLIIIKKLISKLPKCDNLEIDLDWVIEELVEYKKFEKQMKKSICFGKDVKSHVFGLSFPLQYQVLSWKGVNNLNKLNVLQLKNEIVKLRKKLKKDEIIFNTNLPK